MQPTFTPLQAQTMTEGIHGDYQITFDGPQGSPKSQWFPCVTHIPTNTQYVPTGEQTTQDSKWYEMPC